MALTQIKSADGKAISFPYQVFTRANGSKCIVTPCFTSALDLSGISYTGYNAIDTSFYDAESATFYGEQPVCFRHYANSGSHNSTHTFTYHASKYSKSLVPYCLIARVRQWSNRGQVRISVDAGSTQIMHCQYTTDVGKNNRQTRVIMYKYNIFEPYTALNNSGVNRTMSGCEPNFLNYVLDRDNLKDLKVTTWVEWGDRGGYDYINVAMYMGILSELQKVDGIYYVQPSYY